MTYKLKTESFHSSQSKCKYFLYIDILFYRSRNLTKDEWGRLYKIINKPP